MKVLIIGSGGREHALAWKVAQSPLVSKTYVAPGNGGTALETNIENVDIDATAIASLADFAKTHDIGLTIVGPEAPLALGITDHFTQHHLPCFGPTQQAAKLETSKAYSKKFMQRYNIPTAAYNEFSDVEQAKAYLATQTPPYVIKADGLAAGKGVIIATSLAQAYHAVESMLVDAAFGQASQKIIIEEFLSGEEASFMVMTDGQHILPLATSQDHKARDDGDTGPNTGGMGAYSPAPIINEKLERQIINKIIMPTLHGIRQEGAHYCGFLYAGLMINGDDIKVLEYNCRLGDPETQPIMMRLKSDLIPLCEAAIGQKIDHVQAQWDSRVALGVVMCAKGYPKNYPKGDIIQGLGHITANDGKIFHAGTQLHGDNIVTTGGRVLCATGLGENVQQAKNAAYQLLDTVTWQNMYYRSDIGDKAIAK